MKPAIITPINASIKRIIAVINAMFAILYVFRYGDSLKYLEKEREMSLSVLLSDEKKKKEKKRNLQEKILKLELSISIKNKIKQDLLEGLVWEITANKTNVKGS